MVVRKTDKLIGYLDPRELWIGYRRTMEHHHLAFLGAVLRWPRSPGL